MKVKFLFAAALAAMTLASCNKDEATTAPGANGKTNFSVTLPGAVSTYAVEDPQAAGQITPYYNDVTVWLVDAGDNVLGYAWEPKEIKAKTKRFEEIVEPSKVIVVVNKGAATLPMTGTLTAFETALKSIAIEDQNTAPASLSAEDTKGNAVGDYLTVQNVTLMGECKKADFSVEIPDDGHDLRKADVVLKSLVSRFEVGTVKAGTGLKSLTVEAVYVNYFFNEYGMTSMQGFMESTWPETQTPSVAFTPAYMTDAGSTDVTSQDGTKAYAYQVFAGAQVPHIIYKVGGELKDDYKLSDGTTGTFNGKYITVKGFYAPVAGGPDALLTSIEPHMIYKMGLTNGGIEITPEQITDKPEKEKIDLIVAISVANWDVTEVTPEI